MVNKRRTVADGAPLDGTYTPTTLQKIADKLGIPESTMFTLHRRGEGPRTRQLGKRLIVLPEDEAEWYRNLPLGGADKEA